MVVVRIELVERQNGILDVHCTSNVRLQLPDMFDFVTGETIEISHDYLPNSDVTLNGTRFTHDGRAYMSHGGFIFYSDELQKIDRVDMKTYISKVKK